MVSRFLLGLLIALAASPSVAGAVVVDNTEVLPELDPPAWEDTSFSMVSPGSPVLSTPTVSGDLEMVLPDSIEVSGTLSTFDSLWPQHGISDSSWVYQASFPQNDPMILAFSPNSGSVFVSGGTLYCSVETVPGQLWAYWPPMYSQVFWTYSQRPDDRPIGSTTLGISNPQLWWSDGSQPDDLWGRDYRMQGTWSGSWSVIDAVYREGDIVRYMRRYSAEVQGRTYKRVQRWVMTPSEAAGFAATPWSFGFQDDWISGSPDPEDPALVSAEFSDLFSGHVDSFQLAKAAYDGRWVPGLPGVDAGEVAASGSLVSTVPTDEAEVPTWFSGEVSRYVDQASVDWLSLFWFLAPLRDWLPE